METDIRGLYPQPMSKADASKQINSLAKDDDLDLHYKRHASDRLRERGLTFDDVLKCMKYGFVYEDPEPTMCRGYFRYKIEGPFHDEECRRQVSVVVILPATIKRDVKEVQVVTVMWADEK